jgi:hypothetical protein
MFSSIIFTQLIICAETFLLMENHSSVLFSVIDVMAKNYCQANVKGIFPCFHLGVLVLYICKSLIHFDLIFCTVKGYNLIYCACVYPGFTTPPFEKTILPCYVFLVLSSKMN